MEIKSRLFVSEKKKVDVQAGNSVAIDDFDSDGLEENLNNTNDDLEDNDNVESECDDLNDMDAHSSENEPYMPDAGCDENLDAHLIRNFTDANISSTTDGLNNQSQSEIDGK